MVPVLLQRDLLWARLLQQRQVTQHQPRLDLLGRRYSHSVPLLSCADSLGLPVAFMINEDPPCTLPRFYLYTHACASFSAAPPSGAQHSPQHSSCQSSFAKTSSTI